MITDKKRNIKILNIISSYKILIFGFVLPAFYLILEGIIDTYIFHETDLLFQHLFTTDPREMFMHLVPICLILFIGGSSQYLINAQRKAEQKLKESEKKYRHLFETSPMAISLINPNGVIVDCNSNVERILGYKKSDLIGKRILKISAIPKKNIPLILKKFKYLFQDKISEPLEIQLYTKEKESIWVHLHGSLVKLKEETFIQLISQDITDRKVAELKLKVSEEKFKLITSTATDAIIMVSELGKISYWNKAAEKIFNYSVKDIIGKDIHLTIMPERYRKVFLNGFNRFLKTGQKTNSGKTIEIEGKKKDGTAFPIEMSISEIKLNNKWNIVGIIRDITQRKEMEKKLKNSQEKYRKAYNRADFYKDLFTHDINNVLNNIQSSVHLWSIFQDNPKKMKEMEEIILGQIIRGSKLVSNVRKLSQLEDIQRSMQPTEICKVLKKAIDFLHKSTQGRKVNIQFDISDKNLFVRANDLLLDVFENILINAANHNKNPIIEILIRISKKQKEEKNFLKLELIDNGYGIPDTQKRIIFKSGYKNSKTTKGMGFGLTLVKKIVDSYKGEIWVEDKVKGDHTKGSNFVLLIPLVK